MCSLLFTFWLCAHPVVTLGAAQTAAQLWDGYTTRRAVEHGGYEADPLARSFTGRYPTWGTMVPAGTVQIIGTALIAERMRRSHNHVIRKIWFVPQVASTAVSLAMVLRNRGKFR